MTASALETAVALSTTSGETGLPTGPTREVQAPAESSTEQPAQSNVRSQTMEWSVRESGTDVFGVRAVNDILHHDEEARSAILSENFCTPSYSVARRNAQKYPCGVG